MERTKCFEVGHPQRCNYRKMSTLSTQSLTKKGSTSDSESLCLDSIPARIHIANLSLYRDGSKTLKVHRLMRSCLAHLKNSKSNLKSGSPPSTLESMHSFHKSMITQGSTHLSTSSCVALMCLCREYSISSA